MPALALLLFVAAVPSVLALHPRATATLTQSPSSATSSGGTPPVAVSTAVPSPSLPLNSTLPPQAPLPPKQAWCPSDIFCAGSLLQTVNIARPYGDSKTIVDKPTNGSPNHTLADFNALAAPGVAGITEGQIVQFLEQDFKGEGLELEPLNLANFAPDPAFLKNVTDPLLKAWTKAVHGFWTQLIRGTNTSTLCDGSVCESSLIPLNHTFVVPGGRFREQYYWDSYFIVEGLIKSEAFDIIKSTLDNFMDELERFGFIPNGGRIYYLNRSQPPLFIRMLFNYVKASGDVSVLTRAIPLAEVELKWWFDRRTVNITSPYTKATHAVAHYAVDANTAPRPESYLADYQTANGAGDDDPDPKFTAQEKAALYSELASGAESGWDYSSRWIKQPFAGNTSFNLPALRTLNVRNTTPVDLNSILYNARVSLAELYDLSKGQSTKPQVASDRASFHREEARKLRAAILDLFWDPKRLAFYDFNRTANARGTLYSMATFYPLWSGIVPQELLANQDDAFRFFSGVNMVLNKYNGTLPVTFHETGLQWDWPNTWPPHQYIVLQALRNIPAHLTTRPLPTPKGNQTTFDLVPPGQLGITEAQLAPQIYAGGATAFAAGADVNRLNGTITNGGNASTSSPPEGWAHTLIRELSNRYIVSAFCGWHATGGSIPGILPRLPDDQLNVTQSVNNTGNMFEKFSVLDVDSAGRGGEYTVQAGFGWTNGVVLWIAGEFGQQLVAPDCPPLIPRVKTAA